MRRREFIRLFSSTVVAWPLTARAQQAAMPLIGFLSSRSPNESEALVAAFRQGLAETGYVEGQNVYIAFRWGEGQVNRLPALADELVKTHPAVIVAVGGIVSGLAAKAASLTIPIVAIGSELDKAGLVASLGRPGGNVTGVSLMNPLLDAKRLELLRELVPSATTIAILVNPINPVSKIQSRDIQAAADRTKQQIYFVDAAGERDFDAAFAKIMQQGAGALLVAAEAIYEAGREHLVQLTTRHSMPAMFFARSFVADGGFVSYGPSISDAYRQAGVYVGRILRGAKPAELPVQQPIKFQFVINLKTAKALGLNISSQMQLLADEVIE
jgi:putative tryptophan/tyrosine transport system substrate-binding protein